MWDNYSVFYMLDFIRYFFAGVVVVWGVIILLVYLAPLAPFFVFVIALLIYFLPTVIIFYRRETGDLRKKTPMRDTTSKYARTIQDVPDDVTHIILVLNLILGWTIIFWFVCLYFALTEEFENLY